MNVVLEDEAYPIVELETDDGNIITCVQVAVVSVEETSYAAMQVLQTEDEKADEAIILIFRIEENEDKQQVLFGLEEGEEFELVSEALAQMFEEKETTEN